MTITSTTEAKILREFHQQLLVHPSVTDAATATAMQAHDAAIRAGWGETMARQTALVVGHYLGRFVSEFEQARQT